MANFRKQIVGTFLVCVIVTITAYNSAAQVPIAGEDFDGGSTNGGFTASSTTLSPDVPGCNGLFDEFGGACAGSRFDRFGVLDPTINDDDPGQPTGPIGLPFDIIDETVLEAAGSDVNTDDTFGILRSTDRDAVFGLADTENNQNSGPVNASWTFNVAGATNLQISAAFAAVGNFDDDDFFNFTYSIDGGPTQTAFDVLGNDNGTPYSIELENGNQVDRFLDPFFSEADWETLTTTGPEEGVLAFHPADTGTLGDEDADGDVDGTDFLLLQQAAGDLTDFEAEYGTFGGDIAANDGFIPANGALSATEERALTVTNGFGTFDNVENNLLLDPLVVNGTILLDNEFQTVTVPIVGEGTTLTLTLAAVANGGLEYFLFDDILIEGDLPALSAVPEPTTFGLTLISLASVLVGTRRR